MIDINHQSWLSQLIGRNSSSLRPLSLSARCTRVFAYLTGDTLQRESGCFSKGASPSTVDNQFPLHTRARTTPISQGSSPSLLNLKAEIKLRIIRASSLSTARARAHARTKSFLPSGNSLAPVERGNHRGGPLSFPRRINPCDERPLEKFEVSWWDRDPSEAVQLKRFIGQGEGGDRYIASGWDRVCGKSMEREKGRRLKGAVKRM